MCAGGSTVAPGFKHAPMDSRRRLRKGTVKNASSLKLLGDPRAPGKSPCPGTRKHSNEKRGLGPSPPQAGHGGSRTPGAADAGCVHVEARSAGVSQEASQDSEGSGWGWGQQGEDGHVPGGTERVGTATSSADTPAPVTQQTQDCGMTSGAQCKMHAWGPLFKNTNKYKKIMSEPQTKPAAFCTWAQHNHTVTGPWNPDQTLSWELYPTKSLREWGIFMSIDWMRKLSPKVIKWTRHSW